MLQCHGAQEWGALSHICIFIGRYCTAVVNGAKCQVNNHTQHHNCCLQRGENETLSSICDCYCSVSHFLHSIPAPPCLSIAKYANVSCGTRLAPRRTSPSSSPSTSPPVVSLGQAACASCTLSTSPGKLPRLVYRRRMSWCVSYPVVSILSCPVLRHSLSYPSYLFLSYPIPSYRSFPILTFLSCFH